MYPRLHAHRLFTWLVLLSLLATSLPPLTFSPAYAAETPTSSDSGLYRTHVVLDSPSRRARLQSLGVVVLHEDPGSAWVLADDLQLETLAHLRFQPRTSDELGSLLPTADAAQAWLTRSLQPLLQQGIALQGLMTAHAEATTIDSARRELRDALAAMTVEQRAGVTQLVSPDEDLDGLTNTEEAWWCTDYQNPNSDGDAQGYTDGQEVDALLDFTLPRNVRWGYGPPFGPPNAWPNFNDRLGTHVDVCNDGDWDTIPDYAETRVVGSRVPNETTDYDKFDDGQELFGVTYCPGAPTNCGYGSFPAIEYWNYIKATMPNWVRPPGDNLFVAAFPVPEVSVVPGSWTVTRVTTITTTQGQMTQTTNSYETSVMQGQSTSIADTVSWNNWEEVSQAIERPIGELTSRTGAQFAGVYNPNFNWGSFLGGSALTVGGGIGGAALASGAIAGAVGLTACVASVVCGIALAGGAALAVGIGGALLGNAFSNDTPKDSLQLTQHVNWYDHRDLSRNYFDYSTNVSQANLILNNNNFDTQGLVNSLDGIQYALNQQGQLIANGLQDISYAISRPRLTETHTNGHSWGGSQTTTHEVYEEHTITQGQAFTTGENWSTAWAVDSSHAADLTFTYEVKNTGTEYARELTGVIFNIYLGDDKTPIISYPAWQQFPNGKIENLFPSDPPHQFAANPVPLSLDQMRRIDLGEPLRVVLEDFSYGADELFYQDAVIGGMTVFIEDGVDDGDESVDSYVIPTWGQESVQDVLTRYFPAGYDLDGNLNALWTPEFDGINPPVWHEHFLSDIAWWNIYLTQEDAGSTPLKDLAAEAGGAILFRFNRDADRDGYQDRVELRYGTDQNDPADHPQPEILAGYVKEQTGDMVTVKLVLENSGTFDAYGIDAVMYSPDDTTTIGNNTVGGNGKVRPGQHVAVGSLVKPPGLGQWGSSTAKPYSAGSYSGSTDRTYTFSAATPGVVGTGSTTLNWNDGAGGTGTLQVGSSYHSPLPLPVSNGLEVGLTTGTLAASASFTVTALTPRDTFTYTVDGPNYTEPVIVFSYSDPQGSHRFVTPVELPSLDSDLAPYAGQMLKPIDLSIATTGAVAAGSDNTTHLVVNSPHPATIQDGHLYVDFVADGDLVGHQEHTLDIPPGPTVFPVIWSTSTFTQTYDPAADNILLAHWTDSEGNIVDSAARPLNTFAADPKPALAIAAADEMWDFGASAQGTVLKRSFTLANTGQLDLLTYVSAPAGLSVSQTGSRSIAPGNMTTYDVMLNTANLPVGPYDDTITVRTSDPANPTRTIQVIGTVAAAPADTPVGALQRPLDWPATVSGTLGQWVEFTHTLGPEPQTLHPVKVYSQDYSTPYGVGRYAASFEDGTLSSSWFGDGSDGDVVVSSGQTIYTNDTASALSGPAASGQSIIPVVSTTGFQAGDEIMLVQMQGPSAGTYEFVQVSNIGSGHIIINGTLHNSYSPFNVGNLDHVTVSEHQPLTLPGAQVIRVPHYRNVSIQSGGVMSVRPWNGATGGVMVIRSDGLTSILQGGAIDSSGKGFRGGAGGTGNLTCTAIQGESPARPGLPVCSIANGGGGGGGPDHNIGHFDAAGGGGAGFGTNGTNGSNKGYGAGVANPAVGVGGTTYGSTEVSNLFLGSGGGGGGGRGGQGGTGGSGGAGGGLAIIAANNLVISGPLTSRGSNGVIGFATDGRGAGGGGGGSGGTILIQSRVLGLGNGQVNAVGGNGGPASVFGGAGGGGGVGRIRVEYCNAISGSTTPPTTPVRQSCHTVEQVELPPYDRARLNLPESGTHTYQVQYGRRFVFTAAGELTSTLRISATAFSGVALDALVSEVGTGNVTFKLDVGNDGSWDWEATQNVVNAATLTQSDLAAAFNNYWATHGAPTSGHLDVPIRVSLSKAGQVLLTNLQVTATGSKTRFLRLPVQPQGYDTVTASLTVSDGSGPLIVAIDVGDNGSVDWAYADTPGYPANLTTGNLADAINAYLSGHSGEVDVPLRFYLAPFATLNVTDFSATPAGQIDAQVGTGDLAFSTANPIETDPITVTATLHNPGTLDTGGLTAVFSADLPGWGPTPIGVAYVPNISANGSTDASITWDTTGFTGTVPVRVVIDPYNRLAETNENNNEATANLTILTRPDLQTTQLALSNPEPVTDETVDVTLSVHNAGQTTAGEQVVALYDGNPTAGGTLLGSQDLAPLPGNTTVDVVFPWAPTAAGAYRLFARLDRDDQVNESDETNNDTWQDVYIGFRGPHLLDSGNTAADPPYSAALGYGYLNGEAATFCGTRPDLSQRTAPEGEVRYRFDHLLPGHFYHLDLTLFECDGTGRVEVIRVDDNQIGGALDLADSAIHRVSILLDPALYVDHSVTVGISETIGYDAVVARINLHDVDYRYSDAGRSNDPANPNDPAYPYASPGRPARRYGYLDGVDNRPWGSLPYQSRRIDLVDSNPLDDPDNELRYQFDGLDVSKRYRLNLTFFQNAGGLSVHTVYADEFDTGATVNLTGQQRADLTAEIPASAYASDGSAVIRIVRTNALASAFVNVLALEEITSLCDAPDLSCDGRVTVADIVLAAQGWSAGEMTIADVQRVAAGFQP